jgi:hypothetical protein
MLLTKKVKFWEFNSVGLNGARPTGTGVGNQNVLGIGMGHPPLEKVEAHREHKQQRTLK